MTNYQDLTSIPESSYKLAELINGGHYSNIFYFEFHEAVDPSNIYNCQEGLNAFQERSQEFYKIFIKKMIVDENPAIIHIALKVGDVWFISQDCGSNFYLGFGPSGILKLRQACANKNITGFASNESFENWLKTHLRKQRNQSKRNVDNIQFERLCRALQWLTADMQRRPGQFQGMTEENIRSKMLTTLNVIFKGRGHAESKNHKGKTDILIRTRDGLNEHIFELKVWNGIKSLEKAINQLNGYLSWQNNYCGIVLFSYNEHYTDILTEIEDYLRDKYIFDNRNENFPNEFRFHFYLQTDQKKMILCHLCCINLRN